MSVYWHTNWKVTKKKISPVGRWTAFLGTCWWWCNLWPLGDPRTKQLDTENLLGWPDRWLLWKWISVSNFMAIHPIIFEIFHPKPQLGSSTGEQERLCKMLWQFNTLAWDISIWTIDSIKNWCSCKVTHRFEAQNMVALAVAMLAVLPVLFPG